MALLNTSLRKQLHDVFAPLPHPVTLLVFVRTGDRDSRCTVDAFRHLTSPLHLQVFVTPTCPYCPRAVLLAHKLAIASEWVTSDAVDATEFPDLAQRYEVHGVPRTVIDETMHIEGAVPETMLMAQLMPLLAVNA